MIPGVERAARSSSPRDPGDGAQETSGSEVSERVGWVLVAAPIALQALIVRAFGVNAPIGDELHYAFFYRDFSWKGPWLRLLLEQHNEHRMIARKLAFVLIAHATAWDVRAEMYLNVVLAGLVVWGTWKIYRDDGGRSPLLFSPAAWILCGFGQWFNMLCGIQGGFYFTLVGWVWAIHFLNRKALSGVALASFFGALAAFSTINGLLIWPAGLLPLFLSRASRARVGAWCLAAVASTVAYFHNYWRPSEIPPLSAALGHPLALLTFFLRNLGAGLAGGRLHLAMLFGAAIIVVSLLLIAPSVKRRWPDRGAPAGALSLVFLGVASAAAVSVGRSVLGPEKASLESRYLAFSQLALLGILFLLLRRRPFPRAAAAFLVVAAAGFSATELSGLQQAARFHATRLRYQLLLQTYASRSAERLRKSIPELDLVHLRDGLRYLEANRLSVFRFPIDALENEHWKEGLKAGALQPDTPIRQTLISPVVNMRNISIGFVADRRVNRCTLKLSLSVDGRRIASREMRCEELANQGKVFLDVRPPVRDCIGKEFQIDLESPDASLNNSVTVWTFPKYFEGTLAQAGNPEIAGRSLGLEINLHPRGLPFMPRP